MRLAYRKLPQGWDIYWDLRVVQFFSVLDAQAMMVFAGWDEYSEESFFTLRQAEIYTRYTIVCECVPCLQGLTTHLERPQRILAPIHYNYPEREPMALYGR